MTAAAGFCRRGVRCDRAVAAPVSAEARKAVFAGRQQSDRNSPPPCARSAARAPRGHGRAAGPHAAGRSDDVWARTCCWQTSSTPARPAPRCRGPQVVKDELFFNYVLPYATVNERRDDWRKDFYQRFARAAAAVPHADRRRLVLNKEVYAQMKVKFHPDEAAENGAEPLRVGRGRVRLLHRHVDPADRRLPVGRHPGAVWSAAPPGPTRPPITRGWRFGTGSGGPIDAGEAGPFDEAWVKWVAASIDPEAAGPLRLRRFLPSGPDVFSLHLGSGQPRRARRRRHALLPGPQTRDPAGGRSPRRPADPGERRRSLRGPADRRGKRPRAGRLLPGRPGRLTTFASGPSTAAEEIGRQVHIAHDHDEAVVVHVNAYASRRQPGNIASRRPLEAGGQKAVWACRRGVSRTKIRLNDALLAQGQSGRRKERPHPERRHQGRLRQSLSRQNAPAKRRSIRASVPRQGLAETGRGPG